MVKKKIKQQKKEMNKLAFWAPRILMIIYISLITAYVIEQYSEEKLISTLFMNLIPSIILFIFLAIAWHWEEVGAYIFLAVGVIFGFFFNAFGSLAGFSFLVLPIWIIAILFSVSHKLNS